MEDYLKHKLSEYKPEFKEEHWQAASKLLNKRKRRRALVFWFTGALTSFFIILLCFIGWDWQHTNKIIPNHAETIAKTATQSPIASTTSVEARPTHQTQNQKLPSVNSNSAQVIEHSKVDKAQRKINVSKAEVDMTPLPGDLNNNSHVKNNMTLTKAPSSSSSIEMRREIDKLQSIEKSQENKKTMREEFNFLPTQELKNSIQQEQLKPLSEHSDQDNQIPKSHLNSIVMSLDMVDLLPLTLATKYSIKEVKHITIKVSEQRFSKKPFSLSLLGTGLSNGSLGFVYGTELRLQHKISSSTNPYYLHVGVGAGRYSGELSTVDESSLSFRSFASNRYTKTLVPRAAYYVSVPLEIGLAAGHWNLGLNISPEYLIGLRGTVKNEETISIVSSEVITSASSYAVEQNITTTQNTAWLDQSNIRSLAVPIGISLDYRFSQHWSIGVSSMIYIDGLYKLKRPILNNDAVAGSTGELKGGIHISYKF